MGFVLDASTTLDWVLPGQRNVESNLVLPFLMRTFALVPALWHFEVCAVLRDNVRRKIITEATVIRFIAEVETYDIRTARQLPSMQELSSLTARFNLSAYDAAYLQLAKSERLPLATRDEELAVAAIKYGVTLLKP